MSKLRLVLAAGWCVAGLLALNMVLRAQGGAAPKAGRPSSVVEAIRTRCELPANTVVFVVRPDRAEEAR
jgi:hypothetical protein